MFCFGNVANISTVTYTKITYSVLNLLRSRHRNTHNHWQLYLYSQDLRASELQDKLYGRLTIPSILSPAVSCQFRSDLLSNAEVFCIHCNFTNNTSSIFVPDIADPYLRPRRFIQNDQIRCGSPCLGTGLFLRDQPRSTTQHSRVGTPTYPHTI